MDRNPSVYQPEVTDSLIEHHGLIVEIKLYLGQVSIRIQDLIKQILLNGTLEHRHKEILFYKKIISPILLLLITQLK